MSLQKRFKFHWPVFFVALMLVSWGYQHWRVQRIQANVEKEQRRVAESAHAQIAFAFEGIQQQLISRAQRISANRDLVEQLRQYTLSPTEYYREDLVSYLADFTLPERQSIELYSIDYALIAWNGYSMPIEEAALHPEKQDSIRVILTQDGNVRAAISAWMPIQDGQRIVGQVRVMELVTFRMPVENQYLESFSLADTWRRLTRFPVHVRSPDDASIPDEFRRGLEKTLLSHGDVPVARVIVQYPAPDDLINAVKLRSQDLISACLFFLLIWIMIGVWNYYLKMARIGVEKKKPLTILVYFALWSVCLFTTRYIFKALQVPSRWQRDKDPLSPLFDPSHFASDALGGLIQTMGDLFTTAVFLFVFSFALLHFAFGYLRANTARQVLSSPYFAFGWRALLYGSLAGITLLGVTHLFEIVTYHSVMDSTLDYFERSGIWPDRLVLFVFCSLLLGTIGLLLAGGAVIYLAFERCNKARPSGLPFIITPLVMALISLILIRVLYPFWWSEQGVPWLSTIVFWGVGIFIAALVWDRYRKKLSVMNLRTVLITMLLLALPLYLFLFQGLERQQRLRMEQAVASFDPGSDPRVVFSIRQVLDNAKADTSLSGNLLRGLPPRSMQAFLDTKAEALIQGSALSTLGSYDVSLGILDSLEFIRGQYRTGDSPRYSRAVDQDEYQMLVLMFMEQDSGAVFIDQTTSLETDRFLYSGVVPLENADADQPAGWVVLQAEPKSLLYDESALFPRVLLPSETVPLEDNYSLAVFREQVLVRTYGNEYGRYRMEDEIHRSLQFRNSVWREEETGGRNYLTYYYRLAAGVVDSPISLTVGGGRSSTIAVRVPVIGFFDHLYHLLRLIVASLILGVPLYFIGLYLNRNNSFLAVTHQHFKDKVLNAFLLVGILAVGIVGVMGLRVVTSENENAIQSWIRQQLERVEKNLANTAEFGEMPAEVLTRIDVNSLASEVRLDLNVYRGELLHQSSRQQLVRQRLIDNRLPVSVYQELQFGGSRFAFTREQVGAFSYIGGYMALPDQEGRPRYILSVPTLPEQERIEEERARTVAYLFGALLLLLVAVMLTASLLANALTGPIARLREGLEGVAKGRFEQTLLVETNDEIGELVQTFNEMQGQLIESRQQLAQQERQLAWREMARQVAHEIKNPLTPMKLSVQHLRRAFQVSNGTNGAGPSASPEFEPLFNRITSTLIEQVDALARIANEFSSFARLPKRILETLDLNEVILEAVSLMQEDDAAHIQTELHLEPVMIEADREELRRIYINLLKNAIEALVSERLGKVVVTTAVQDDQAYSTVKDNGAGIPVEMREKIFQPNFSSKTSGTGLGLAIVQKAVEAMHGEIGFETKLNVGTTFWVRIPLEEA